MISICSIILQSLALPVPHHKMQMKRYKLIDAKQLSNIIASSFSDHDKIILHKGNYVLNVWEVKRVDENDWNCQIIFSHVSTSSILSRSTLVLTTLADLWSPMFISKLCIHRQLVCLFIEQIKCQKNWALALIPGQFNDC